MRLLAALVLLAGCDDEKKEPYGYYLPSKVYEANGFKFSFYGSRSENYAPCGAMVDPVEIGVALEAEAIQLADSTFLNSLTTIAVLRSMRIGIVDDTYFMFMGQKAAGVWLDGWMVVTLGTPGNYVPAADHELGHEFFGSNWGHH